MSSAVSAICSLNRSTVAASCARLCSEAPLTSTKKRVMSLPPWVRVILRTNSGASEWFLALPARRGIARVNDRLRQFGAEQEDLRGVVDPEHQDDQRTRGAIGRIRRGLTEVPSDQRFSDGEQHGCDKSAQHKMTPVDRRIRQHPVDRCEQQREDAE